MGMVITWLAAGLAAALAVVLIWTAVLFPGKFAVEWVELGAALAGASIVTVIALVAGARHPQ